MTSPEGIDCGAWIKQLKTGQMTPDLTMADFWAEAEVIGVSTR